MGYKVIFSNTSLKTLNKLDNSIRTKIIKFLDREVLKENPRAFGKALQYKLSGLWRYRVKNFRILADIRNDVLTVLIIDIGDRSDVYK
ncbi:MAG: type II toxin-antitoxin system RelE/ParE family toxin [Endomicrobium sp.]|jgi:mRNA interferase RelE/StbE|nr:type II toxin-antitoxin system RelE/ParE family toxin [Endomicrobium sp.]